MWAGLVIGANASLPMLVRLSCLINVHIKFLVHPSSYSTDSEVLSHLMQAWAIVRDR